MAQSTMNLFENFLNISYLVLIFRSNKSSSAAAIAPFVGFTAAALTLAKTALYVLVDCELFILFSFLNEISLNTYNLVNTISAIRSLRSEWMVQNVRIILVKYEIILDFLFY